MGKTLYKKQGRVYNDEDRDFELGLEDSDNETQKTIAIQVEVSYGVFEERTIHIENQPCVIMNEKILYFMSESLGSNTAKCITIYLILLSHRNRVNNKCFPSISRLSKLSGLSKRTINSVLTLLEENGYIIINEGKNGMANEYFFPKEWFFDYFQEDVRQINASRPDKETRKEKHTSNKKDNNGTNKDKQQLKEQESIIKEKDELLKQQNETIKHYDDRINNLLDMCRNLGDTNVKLTKQLADKEREIENNQFANSKHEYDRNYTSRIIEENFDD